MSERKINLEEILENHFHLYTAYGVKNNDGKFMSVVDKEGAINAMKEACRQTLELAAENAETEKEMLPECGVLKSVGVVDKQSILNTINQIE